MFCPQCARDCGEGTNYCCHCGAALFSRPPRRESKKLVLSQTDKKIAGVCGGFADYLDLDPTIVRVVWVMAALLVGWGFLGYLIAWLVIPRGPEAASATDPAASAQPAR